MELTREMVGIMAMCSGRRCDDCKLSCGTCGRTTREDLAVVLLAELDKSKVWDGAPEWATHAWILWGNESRSLEQWRDDPYTRTPPKSRIDEIAKEVGTKKAEEYNWNHVAKQCAIDIAKSAILKDREERDGK